MNFSDQEIEEYEQELENTDIKALLIHQNAYLDAILRELQGARDSTQSDASEDTYTCKHCRKEIPESDLEGHAKSHNLPPGMDVMTCFE